MDSDSDNGLVIPEESEDENGLSYNTSEYTSLLGGGRTADRGRRAGRSTRHTRSNSSHRLGPSKSLLFESRPKVQSEFVSDEDDQGPLDLSAEQKRKGEEVLERLDMPSIFRELRDTYGFQSSSVENQLEHYQLLVRGRMHEGCGYAIKSVYDEVIGKKSNYYQWTMSLLLDEESQTPDSEESRFFYHVLDSCKQLQKSIARGWKSVMGEVGKRNKKRAGGENMEMAVLGGGATGGEIGDEGDIGTGTAGATGRVNSVGERRQTINPDRAATKQEVDTFLETADKFEQAVKMIRCTALYLCLWGEAANFRFAPEFICFLYRTAYDYRPEEGTTPVEENFYLNKIIKPLYNFLFDESHLMENGKPVLKAKDHSEKILYDDINECVWTIERIRNIKTDEGLSIVDVDAKKRYRVLEEMNWSNSFKKTFYEYRTPWHILVNYLRVWVVHLTTFVMIFRFSLEPISLFSLSLGFTTGLCTMLVSQIVELFFVSVYKPHLLRLILGASSLCSQIVLILLLFEEAHRFAFEVCYFVISLLTFMLFFSLPRSKWPFESKPVLMGNWPSFPWHHMLSAKCFWVGVLMLKMSLSYSVMIITFAMPYKYIMAYNVEFCTSPWLCEASKKILIAVCMLMNFIFYCIDTNIWYTMSLSFMGYFRGIFLGLYNYQPWKGHFVHIWERMSAKVVAIDDMNVAVHRNDLVAPLWNAVIEEMWEDYLLTDAERDDLKFVKIAYYDQTSKEKIYVEPIALRRALNFLVTPKLCVNEEANRRLSFFARSLAMKMPLACSIEKMKSFTCFTPHYSETIMYSSAEIHSPKTGPTESLIDYLSLMFKDEWNNFMTREHLTQEEFFSEEIKNGKNGNKWSDKDFVFYKAQAQRPDFDAYRGNFDFRNAPPETLRKTRRWASLRAQTLYRTVKGMMTYEKALRLLTEVEKPFLKDIFTEQKDRDEYVDNCVKSKFSYLLAMQRYFDMNSREREDTEDMLKEWPNLNIAYIEKTKDENGEFVYASCLVDGHCELLPNGMRKPKYRVIMPGFPILGDGKSDNQNHSIIFARGEILQVIDANQENYLEECYKIRNVLEEFEPEPNGDFVAIVGAREHIFSANLGALANNSGMKEYVFGTLIQRALTVPLHVRYHYGHPDFLNKLFCITRGGVSKGTKGLHVNEDVYCGMASAARKGVIKHIEYAQVGKGRDMGFIQILGFVTKIARGAGEQSLSRDHYRMGTYMPLHTHLSFYFSLLGFHFNTVLLLAGINVYILACYLSSAFAYSAMQAYPCTDPDIPCGQSDFGALFEWIGNYAVFVSITQFALMVSILFQVGLEMGIVKAVVNTFKQLLAFSPVFEIFSIQLNSVEFFSNVTGGQASYIATGRGFAVSRNHFSTLYMYYANTNMKSGFYLGLMLLFVMHIVSLSGLIFFWFIIFSFIFAPFVFNTRQFLAKETAKDVYLWVRCLFEGHGEFGTSYKGSWIETTRNNRVGIVGQLPNPQVPRGIPSSFSYGTIVDGNLPYSLIITLSTFIVFYFQFLIRVPFPDSETYVPLEASFNQLEVFYDIALLIMVSPGLNFIYLLGAFFINLGVGHLISPVNSYFGYGFAIVSQAVQLYLMFRSVGNDYLQVIMMLIITINVQQTLKMICYYCMGKEDTNDDKAFWSGKWINENSPSTRNVIVRVIRELLCKNIELSDFTCDVIVSFMIQIPLLLLSWVPYLDKLQTAVMFSSFELVLNDASKEEAKADPKNDVPY